MNKQTQSQPKTENFPKIIPTLKKSIDQLKVNPQFLIVLLTILGLGALLSYLGHPTAPGFETLKGVGENELPANPLLFAAGSAIVGFGFLIFSIPLIAYAITTAKNETKSFGELFSAWRHIISLLVAGLLTGILVLGGYLLLIIPGIIISARLSFPGYLIIDKKFSAIESMKKSFEMTKGYTIKIILFSLVLTLISIVFVLALGMIPVIGEIAINLVYVVIMVAFANLYVWFARNRFQETKTIEKTSGQ